MIASAIKLLTRFIVIVFLLQAWITPHCYSQQLYYLSVSAGQGGTVTGGNANYPLGAQVELFAIPNSGYVFQEWFEPQKTSTSNPITVTVTNGVGHSNSYSVSFWPLCTVTVNANPANGGIVSGSGVYRVGAYPTISATASPNWTFTGWNDGVTTNPRTFEATPGLNNGPGSVTYTANFSPAVPAMPPWALAILAVLLCIVSGLVLRKSLRKRGSFKDGPLPEEVV